LAEFGGFAPQDRRGFGRGAGVKDNMTKKEYLEYVDEKSPNSPFWKDLFFAYLIGGAICVLGQGIADAWRACGFSEPHAAALTSASLILLSMLLTGCGVYDKIAKRAGAGTLVPITGFANAVVAPAMEFRSEGLALGLAAKMFVIAGPVLVYGIGASVLSGLYHFILTLF
jgi:stage V sporulation protein AC